MNKKIVLDVNELRAGEVETLPEMDHSFTIFNDEINNIRKLYLTEDACKSTAFWLCAALCQVVFDSPCFTKPVSRGHA